MDVTDEDLEHRLDSIVQGLSALATGLTGYFLTLPPAQRGAIANFLESVRDETPEEQEVARLMLTMMIARVWTH